MDAANANIINSNPWNLLGLITGIAVMALMLLGQDPNIIIILQGVTLVCILLGLLHSLKHKGTLDSAINQLQRLLKDGTQQFAELDLPGWKPLLDELSRWRQSQQQQQAILKALDICQANVMVANPAGDILYFNHSLQQTMQDAEADIQEVLPKFQADKLQGANMDVFHRNPEHQRKLIAGLEQVYSTQIKVGRRTFSLIASPVFDENKQRIATVVEWQDLTEALGKQQLEQQSATENTRIKQALNVCQANVMVADTDYNIIYLNDSLNEMLAGNEQKLQQELQAFNMSKLIGSNIDIFHRHPEHQRQLLDQLTDSYNTRIKVAGLTFNLIATPVFEQGKRTGTVVEWQDITASLAREQQEKQLSAENARIRQALDNVSSNTMVADNDGNIIYLNQAVQQMFQAAEKDILRDLPKFNASKLLGQNIDGFHKVPSHQRNILAGLTETYDSQLQVGGRTFRIIANPILDPEQGRIGTVVEWADRTNEVAIEQEIDAIITAANDGDLSRRLDIHNKEGFFLNLSNGLNRLVGIADNVISKIADIFDGLAKGQLDRKLDGEYQGQFAKLQQDANATISKLTEVIGGINDSANTVTSGAEEIAQGNADLSQRTEEQAASLEQTASSMEQMTATVKQSAENATLANNLAQEASEKAGEGGKVVKQAVSAMEEINTSSKRIADIISVIDEIAFQTNLLALNAAVEAARAGEQGRGFAVVAGEVRNLAQRSAGAAKEIKELIRDSVNKVTDGTQLVNQSGETLQEIVQAVSKVAGMINQISIAAEQQSVGIQEVNKAVSQMDEMTQQNAALVEQVSAAGDAMAEQARSMKRQLGFFNTANLEKGAGKPLTLIAGDKSPKIRVSSEEWSEF